MGRLALSQRLMKLRQLFAARAAHKVEQNRKGNLRQCLSSHSSLSSAYELQHEAELRARVTAAALQFTFDAFAAYVQAAFR